MTNAFRVFAPQPRLGGTVALESSKSLSNRALIIRSFCDVPFDIQNLSTSDDTDALVTMLSSDEDDLYSGHAGSSYRFMVAKACFLDREVTIDASEQLRRRPIGPLVRALQTLGADITYLNKEGFPPLRVRPVKDIGKNENEITLQSGISSQYITALLLIAPCLPNGLTIHLLDEPVSASYIYMTLNLMQYFGIPHTWENNTIRIEPGKYQPKPFRVEGDWSSASYYYSIVALAQEADLHIEGLHAESIQGDATVASLYASLGVETIFEEKGIHLRKNKAERPKEFAFDFSRCPDLAQTIMVTLAGLGIKGKLSGLKTLRIKETDRLAAMQAELARIKTTLEIKEEQNNITCLLFGKAKWKDKAKFNTYEDHRMAMAFAPLACLNPIVIKNPEVVSKSYPGFWKDIDLIGIKTIKTKEKGS